MSPGAAPSPIETVLRGTAVLPVLTIERLADAVPIAQALLAGGLPVLEVTLRTPVALEALSRIVGAVPGALVGAGSVVDAAQFAQVRAAGARFAVSPGATADLEAAASAAGLPWLPAAQSVSEVLALRARGYRFVKLFPADASGGIGFLKSILAPVPDVRFCPTGGITAANARDYLALPNVACVGGSWLTPAPLLASGDWEAVRALAEQASQLRP
jgi:2-dehydro-3-deoxyphosphogluconate aldolase / (4S)-4-hydroxy-2-oxoglutarate aldolase